MPAPVRVLVCCAGSAPVVESLTSGAEQLAALQALCGGGYVECVGLAGGVELWCNEDGRALRLPLNRVIEGHHIMGTFVLSRVDAEGEVASLTDADVAAYQSQLSQEAA